MNPYENKTIAIIGAGLLQVPAIKVANELGLKTVVTDYNENAPGMKLADYPIVMSIRDIDGTVRVLKEFNKKVKIDGVLTIGTDASMTVAAVANALGLPGIPFENAEAASNKYKMRQRLKEHNVPIPNFFKCWSFDDLKKAASKLGYPFVLKPVDNMGARGVIKIEHEGMLEFAFNHAKRCSPCGELIAEEYMKGDELSIDAIVFNNEIKITGIADRIISREPYFIELGHVMPSNKPKEVLEDAVNVFKKAIKAIGITLGAAKGDIKITSEGAKIVEIAARLSGGFMSAYTYPYSTGVNLIRIAIDIALGIEPDPKLFVPIKNRVSIEKAIIPEPGILKEIKGIEEAYSIPGVMNIFLRVNIGDEIIEPTSNVEKAGNIIVVKDTREEAWETMDKAEKIIKLVTVPKALTYEIITKKAKEYFNKFCYVCSICNGIECKGKIPGLGGVGNGDAFIKNYQDFNVIKIKTKVIHDIKEVDTTADFFGIKLSLPLLISPISGIKENFGGTISELEYDLSILSGSKKGSILAFLGDSGNEMEFKGKLEVIKRNNGYGGIILKPYSDQEKIKKMIKELETINIKVIGLDINAYSTLNSEFTIKSFENIIELKEFTKVPFVLKGVMSIEDAISAINANIDAIIISNNGGRIIENHPSTISILKEIVEVAKGKIKIIIDGGIRSGEDIFKAIAMGADYVMIGRPFAIAVMGARDEGVDFFIKMYKRQFEQIMILTGCKRIDEINKNFLILEQNFLKKEDKIFSVNSYN